MDMSAAAFSFVSVNRPAIKKNPFKHNVKYVDEELNPFSQSSLDNVVFREPSGGPDFNGGPGSFNAMG